MSSVFVIYEPKSDHGDSILEVVYDEKEARDRYNSHIVDGTANIDCGQYLLKTEIDGNSLDLLKERLDTLFPQDFEGGEVPLEVLERFAGDNDRWDPSAFDYDDEEFSNSDEDYVVN